MSGKRVKPGELERLILGRTATRAAGMILTQFEVRHRRYSTRDVDGDEIWEAYVEQTEPKWRTPQGAIAFALAFLRDRKA